MALTRFVTASTGTCDGRVRRSISRDNSPGGWVIRCQEKRVRPGAAIGPESAPPPNGGDAAWVLCDFDDLL
jgi:hypothetical protein